MLSEHLAFIQLEAQQNIAYIEELGGEFYHPSDGSVVDW